MADLAGKSDLRDIESRENVRLMVDTFYGQARHDALLGPIFDEAISNWEDHLPTMYQFWERLLFRTGDYQGNPFAKHMNLPVGKEHFTIWLKIFNRTVDENFYGPRANEAKRLAKNIAATFQLRLGINSDDVQYAVPNYSRQGGSR